MKKVGFSDWQEMALKKDIEDIKRQLNAQEPILFSLCWEIIVTLGAIIVDRLFDIDQTPIWLWIIVSILAIIPAVIVLFYKFIWWIRSMHLVKKGNLKIRVYIDMFDNHVSYWVMLSNSYGNLLTEALSDEYSTDAEKEFLYREGCYYNNKSMQALYSMKPNFDKIFTSDIDVVKKKNLIDLARLHNLLKVMNEQQVRLDRDIQDVSSEGVVIQQNLNKKYLDELKEFLEDVNQVFFPMVYNWNSD